METINCKQYGIRSIFYYLFSKKNGRSIEIIKTVVTMNNTKLYMWLPTDDAGLTFFGC